MPALSDDAPGGKMEFSTMRRSALASVVLLFWTTAAWSQFAGEPAELSLIEVRDDIYVIHNALVPGNVTALITDEGVLLVDDKYAVDYENIMDMLASITDQPVVYVVNTHYHGDHSGSNALMQDEGARVIASENARVKMIEGNQPGLPDLTLDEHMRIHIGGVPVDIYQLGRGHTDGDIVVHFPEQRVLAAGDLFTNGRGLPQLIDYAGGGSARAWTQTLTRVLTLDFETVVPGHGRVSTYAELMAYRDESQRLQDTVREMNRAGRTPAEIEAVLRSEFGFEDFHIGMALEGMLVELR
jgi:glyoxylase-like metal-dependent hydrolase (beta-lactamase superfamily II)